MDIKVFVYGSLQKGEPNHYLLTNPNNGQQRFIGKALTKELYSLIITTECNVPCLLDMPGVGQNIHGEVYEVDEAMFKVLDHLEDYPRWYTRWLKPVTLENGEEIEAWIYFLHDFKDELMEYPTMSSYSTYGDHGRQFNINLEEDEELALQIMRQVKKNL